MRNKTFRVTDAAEAAVLDQVRLRLVLPEEQARWEQLMSEHHYLENGNLVGERWLGNGSAMWRSIKADGWGCWAGQRRLII